MTKSGRAEKSRTLFAHAVLAQIKEEKLKLTIKETLFRLDQSA